MKIPKKLKVVTSPSFFIGLGTSFLVVAFVVVALFQGNTISVLRQGSNLVKLTKSQEEKIASLSARITQLEQEDLRVTNEAMKASVSAVNTSFSLYATLLEKIADAKVQKVDVSKQETELPKIVRLLADLKYQEAKGKITETQDAVVKAVSDAQAKAASSGPPAVASQSLLTGDGLNRQSVQIDSGSFTVTFISADLSSTRILTDSVSENDCVDTTCPTKPLADYVSSNGGFAGINGSYFCPPDYAQCADKPGSFGTLLFNSRLSKYINSDNNKFSTVPMFVQTSDHGTRFMGQTVEWGRDTGIIGGIANYPLLVSGGQPATSDETGGGGRNFIGVKNGRVYIGRVNGANLSQAAKVLSTLGMENALNLDTGGSTALYYNGSYVFGPGRLLPNAVILAH